MLTVLTWLWRQPESKNAYTAAHVNIWAAMVRRHLAQPHRLACVTDLPEGIDPGVEIIAPPREFEDVRIPTWNERRPQCLRRLSMFRADAARIFGERFVCMDLDVAIGGSLDPLFAGDHAFRMFRGSAPGRPYNGSMMLLKAGARTQVYERFTPQGATEAGRKFVGSDQAWISHVLGPREATWGAEHGVHWWRNRPQADAERGGARIIFFPGQPKPWDVATYDVDPWVAAHYRGAASGRCLLLGDGPGLWSDVEAALDGGRIDAVIATEAAAAHWPGPVLAVALNAAQAGRIARMHGFSEVVRCGFGEAVAA